MAPLFETGVGEPAMQSGRNLRFHRRIADLEELQRAAEAGSVELHGLGAMTIEQQERAELRHGLYLFGEETAVWTLRHPNLYRIRLGDDSGEAKMWSLDASMQDLTADP